VRSYSTLARRPGSIRLLHWVILDMHSPIRRSGLPRYLYATMPRVLFRIQKMSRVGARSGGYLCAGLLLRGMVRKVARARSVPWLPTALEFEGGITVPMRRRPVHSAHSLITL